MARGLYPRVDRDERSKMVVLFLMFNRKSWLKWPKNGEKGAAVLVRKREREK